MRGRTPGFIAVMIASVVLGGAWATAQTQGQGDSFSQTFDTAGEFDYFCKIHGAAGQGMAGTVVVEAAGEDPAPEEGAPEPTDEPADAGEGDGEGAGQEPGTADEPADTTDTDVTAADEQDPADAADDGKQLADTGGRCTPLLGLGSCLAASSPSGAPESKRADAAPCGGGDSPPLPPVAST